MPRSSLPRASLLTGLLLGLLFPADATSQLRAGVTFSDVSGIDGFESRQGFTGGVALSFLQFGPVSLIPELLYVQKGAKRMTPSESGIEDIRLDYFVVPALLEVGGYIRGTGIRPSIFGGLYYAFQTSCSLGFNTGEERSNGCPFFGLQEMGIAADLEDSDWGWVIGGTLAYFTAAIGSISVDLRYTTSIDDIARQGSIAEPKNRSIELTAGWRPSFR